MLLEPIEVYLGNFVHGVPWTATYFHIFQGHHLAFTRTNMYITMGFQFLCGPYTKVRKPHFLPKRLDFISNKKLATLQRTTMFGRHKPNGIVLKNLIATFLHLSPRRMEGFISLQLFTRPNGGQQIKLNKIPTQRFKYSNNTSH